MEDSTRSDTKRLESGLLDGADVSLGVCAKVIVGVGGAPECRDLRGRGGKKKKSLPFYFQSWATWTMVVTVEFCAKKFRRCVLEK